MKKRSRKKSARLTLIGWREWVALPQLGIERIKVKADSGARSSALHAYDVVQTEVEGEAWVRFKVHPIQRDSRTVVEASAPLIDERWVRSSTGRSTLRPVIRTDLAIAGAVWPIEVTLVRRDLMGFRMLLGRQAMRPRLVVHPGRSFLLRDDVRRQIKVVRVTKKKTP